MNDDLPALSEYYFYLPSKWLSIHAAYLHIYPLHV
jgi:hypothetical protein